MGHFFFVFVHLLCCKGRSLRCSPGQGNAGHCSVMLYMGEGLRGINGACSTLRWISVTPSTTHNQIGPLWCCFPGGWACVCSRTLWVSPRNSPVRLGVSPAAAASTPTGVFTQRLEALFPRAGALGCAVCCWVHQLQPCQPRSTICHLAGSASHRLARSPLCPTARLHPSCQAG